MLNFKPDLTEAASADGLTHIDFGITLKSNEMRVLPVSLGAL
jgi:hypothetical protein